MSYPCPYARPVTADAGQVAGDVVERDRLCRRRDPTRCHHDRQPLDQPENRLERGAPSADDMAARNTVTGTPADASRSPVSRRLRRWGERRVVGAEPAEVDDLPRRRAFAASRETISLPGGPAARNRARRASGRGSRRHPPVPRPRRRRRRWPRRRPPNRRCARHAAVRETAVNSCSRSRGRSARPTTPVAPKMVTFMSSRSVGDRRSGG